MVEYTAELTKWLVACGGTLKGSTPVTADTVQIWEKLLMSEGVTVDEMTTAFSEVLKTETFFPTPSEVLKRVMRDRPSFAVIHDPVEVLIDGRAGVASRRVAEQESLPAPVYELRELPCKHLPTIPIAKSVPDTPTTGEIESKRELMRRQAGKC